jgi:hypothetical protein
METPLDYTSETDGETGLRCTHTHYCHWVMFCHGKLLHQAFSSAIYKKPGNDFARSKPLLGLEAGLDDF